ncbi:hypothetical protein ACHAW5_007845 [Stephanodiscus triporus]|uniref:tRNA (guanine(9)-N(1))-methyltransferase n=1 Tax=Stephanodiscus triporus TaxID=2934178 RepID=A0ABD3Q6S8_9STRA
MAESMVGDTFERLRINGQDNDDSAESDSQRAAVSRKEHQSSFAFRRDGNDVGVASNTQSSSILLSDGDDILLNRTSDEPTLNDADLEPSSSSRRPILICDAWYGFPPQKRPRTERINAVSKQLSNFLEWRRQSVLATPSDSSCRVSLLGNREDVHAVHDRMDELALSDNTDVPEFQPITIHEFLHLERIDEDENEVLYLSPDAIHTVSCTSPPPRIVIIGMLIDRRITANRSLIRAEKALKLKAKKLPLDELHVRGLKCQEPLNVDTVMELMQRWHWNCDKVVETQQHDTDGSKALYRDCFLKAAALAMKSQRERHPNRTIHLT